MTFNIEAALLEAVVLSLVAKEGTYGYKITQDIRALMEISESTLYPVLRRLQKNGCLETYNQEFSGRNRRYYKITSHGMIELDSYRRTWMDHRKKVEGILFGD